MLFRGYSHDRHGQPTKMVASNGTGPPSDSHSAVRHSHGQQRPTSSGCATLGHLRAQTTGKLEKHGHDRRSHSTSHAWCKTYRASELKPYVVVASARLAECPQQGAVALAIQELASVLAGETCAASQRTTERVLRSPGCARSALSPAACWPSIWALCVDRRRPWRSPHPGIQNRAGREGHSPARKRHA